MQQCITPFGSADKVTVGDEVLIEAGGEFSPLNVINVSISVMQGEKYC